MNVYAPPFSEGHLLGTDNFGRDILSRLIYGARISLFIGIVVVAIASVLGTTLGLLAGYFGGWVDVLIMRMVEIFYAFPFLVLVIAVIAIFGPSIYNVMWVLGLVSWPLYARLVRAQVLVLRETEFVEAARAAGMGPARIMFRHILPNTLTPILVTATFGIPEAILASAALGFLGLGVQPPTPEWGVMISEGKDFIRRAPHLITWPGVAIMLVVLSFNFVGDALRDALDPHKAER
jgi:peptide/nickel transport system permease protein